MIWSVTKSCPDSSYDGAWYFYEDRNELAPKWLSTYEVEKLQDSKQTVATESKSSENQGIDDTWVDMSKYLQQSYTLDQQIQSSSWYPVEDLSWTVQDASGNQHAIKMNNLLPSKEALPTLLQQIDKCNAYAVKLWLENPYKESAGQDDVHPNIKQQFQWYILNRQLEREISLAKEESVNIKSDAEQKFDIIDYELNSSEIGKNSYITEYQSKRENYISILDEIIRELEQSRVLSSKITNGEINPFTMNGR